MTTNTDTDTDDFFGLSKYKAVPMVPADAVAAAACRVLRDWGEEAYSMGLFCSVDGVHVFQVLARIDGAEFYVCSDRWGNVGHGDTPRQAVNKLRKT